MKISQNGIAVLKQHEGLRLKAYDDMQPNKTITSASQVLGTLTIGYGHTKGVYVGQTITPEKAVQFLKEDLAYFENVVSSNVAVPLNQNMADALISFVYNVGDGNFKGSTLLKYLNQGNYITAADEFLKWRKSGGVVLPALEARRADERELFLRDFGVLAYLYNSDAKPKKNDGLIATAIGVALMLV